MSHSHSKVLILTSAMLALAASDSCSDCTAVVSHIADRLSTPESLAAQGVAFLRSKSIFDNSSHDDARGVQPQNNQIMTKIVCRISW